jgi:uncharacterized protein YkwD
MLKKNLSVFLSLSLVTIVLLGVALQGQLPTSAQSAFPDPAIIQDLFNRTNALRERRGLPPYRMNAALTAAAQDQANWLVESGRRGHFRPDGSRPSTRAAVAGYVTTQWCCGENYYMSIDATPDMVWDFWRASPSHRVNLLHRTFDDVGFGMATNGTRISYVMVFGDGADNDPAPPPASTTEQPVGGDPSVAPSPGDPSIASTNSDPAAAATGGTTYTVAPGENLYRIALRYGTTVAALSAANGISDPTRISVGQVLTIPGR